MSLYKKGAHVHFSKTEMSKDRIFFKKENHEEMELIPINRSVKKTVINDESCGHSAGRTACWRICSRVSRLLDINLLRRKEFLYLSASNFLLGAGTASAMAFVPQHCQDRGISEETVGWIVSGCLMLEVMSRITFGVIADKKWCHRSTMMGVSAILLGLTAQMSYLMTSLTSILVYSIVSGFLQGQYYSLYVVVMLDVLDEKDLKVFVF